MDNVHDVYEELFHYTDLKGLMGILESQELWATHYKFLNDSTETKLMREALPKFLKPKFMSYLINNKTPEGSIDSRVINEQGGIVKVSEDMARSATNGVYNFLFENKSMGKELASPYIISFCSHKDEYENENGLLSQWRGYSGNKGKGKEGFAIVFNTEELWKLIKIENSLYNYVAYSFCDAVYEGEKGALYNELLEQIKTIADSFISFNKGCLKATEKFLLTSMIVFTRFKHRGFKEEREIRIVMFPYAEEHSELFDSPEEQAQPNLPFKKIDSRDREGEKTDFIKLFGGSSQPRLPIKRIIIGPHKDQKSLQKDLMRLVEGLGIDVDLCKTPFVD